MPRRLPLELVEVFAVGAWSVQAMGPAVKYEVVRVLCVGRHARSLLYCGDHHLGLDLLRRLIGVRRR